MARVKIFVFDDLVLGGAAAQRLLQGQTYCFPLDTGEGYGLFASGEHVALIANSGWDGASGDLWQVDHECLGHVSRHYEMRGARQHVLYLDGMSAILTWCTPLHSLRKKRMRRITSYRDYRLS